MQMARPLLESRKGLHCTSISLCQEKYDEMTNLLPADSLNPLFYLKIKRLPDDYRQSELVKNVMLSRVGRIVDDSGNFFHLIQKLFIGVFFALNKPPSIFGK